MGNLSEYLDRSRWLAGSWSSSSSACGNADRCCAAIANRCGKNSGSKANPCKSTDLVGRRKLNRGNLPSKDRFEPEIDTIFFFLKIDLFDQSTHLFGEFWCFNFDKSRQNGLEIWIGIVEGHTSRSDWVFVLVSIYA